jgi:hypothetical protein
MTSKFFLQNYIQCKDDLYSLTQFLQDSKDNHPFGIAAEYMIRFHHFTSGSLNIIFIHTSALA